MARKSNQQIRREELIDAAQDAVARKGLAAVQLRDIAQLAELTPGAILYYYDDLHDLLRQVYERATQRYSVQREQAIAEISSPALRLGHPATHVSADRPGRRRATHTLRVRCDDLP